MLKSLRLRNFRGFENHYLPFNKNTVIVGKNNAGKSSIIEALRLISLLTARFPRLTLHPVPEWLEIGKSLKGLTIPSNSVDISEETIFHRYGDPPAIVQAEFLSGERIDLYIGPSAKIHAVLFSRDGKPATTTGLLRNLDLPKVAILPQISPLREIEPLLTRDYVQKSMLSNKVSFHFRNQLNLYFEKFEQFTRMAEDTWPGLRVVELRGRESLPVPDSVLSLMIQDGDFVAEVGWMGHGLQMWLQTIWFLVLSEDAHTVILDEPDVYMHADLQRRLIGTLRRGSQQLIVATHSSEIMAEADAEDILVIDRAQPASKFTADIAAVQNVLHHIGSFHNLQLTRFWSSRILLLIEGHDMTFINKFQDLISPKSAMLLSAVPCMPIGGWSGWSFAVGSSMLLKNAGGEHIYRYCILDSDYHIPEQIEERMNDAKKHGVYVHIWNKKEIENYLLVPSAIARYIKGRSPRGGSHPSTAEISEKLMGLVGSYRDEVFDNIANEYLNHKRAEGVQGANRRARTRMGQIWTEQNMQLNAAPGKKILADLSAWSKATYGVSISAASLASSLMMEELDPEIVRVLRCIELHQPFDKNET